MRIKKLELLVGLFMIAGLLALLVLALKVSGLSVNDQEGYKIFAEFDNIGDLKVRAPVVISGVTIGRVQSIELDPKSFRAEVTMQIKSNINQLPKDTAASIFTQGILGANYISLTPGFDTENLKSNDRIQTTHSALILENLIGQLIYSVKNNKTGG